VATIRELRTIQQNYKAKTVSATTVI